SPVRVGYLIRGIESLIGVITRRCGERGREPRARLWRARGIAPTPTGRGGSRPLSLHLPSVVAVRQAPDFGAALGKSERLVRDQRPEKDGLQADGHECGELAGERVESKRNDGGGETWAAQRVHEPPAKADVSQEVDGDPTDERCGRDLVERVPDVL